MEQLLTNRQKDETEDRTTEGESNGGEPYHQPGNEDGNSGPTLIPGAEPQNRHFYMSAKLDNVRINKNVNDYVQEIIQHLMNVQGADVEIRLDVEVSAPNGIPNNTVRTVSENCKTLKVTDFGFDN